MALGHKAVLDAGDGIDHIGAGRVPAQNLPVRLLRLRILPQVIVRISHAVERPGGILALRKEPGKALELFDSVQVFLVLEEDPSDGILRIIGER